MHFSSQFLQVIPEVDRPLPTIHELGSSCLRKEQAYQGPLKAVLAFVFASSSLHCESDWRYRCVGFRVVVVI